MDETGLSVGYERERRRLEVHGDVQNGLLVQVVEVAPTDLIQGDRLGVDFPDVVGRRRRELLGLDHPQPVRSAEQEQNDSVGVHDGRVGVERTDVVDFRGKGKGQDLALVDPRGGLGRGGRAVVDLEVPGKLDAG